MGIAFAPETLANPANDKDYFIDEEEANWSPLVDEIIKLNANCVRLYQVCSYADPELSDPSFARCGSHDKFMNKLAQHGIYVIVSLISGGNFHSNILRGDLPAGDGKGENDCYGSWIGQNLFNSAAARVMDFARYPNTFAFNVGNELEINGDKKALPKQTGILAYPCVKALARDIKALMKKQGLRPIPTFYAMQDSAGGPISMNPQTHYLACSPDGNADDTIDMVGYNIYTWCHSTDTYESVYARLISQMDDNKIPLILSEYGCTGAESNKNDPTGFVSVYPWQSNFRTWLDVPSIFSDSQLGARFSGAVAYALTMYAGLKDAQQNNGRISESYGLLATAAAGNTDPGQPDIVELPTFGALKDQYQKVKDSPSVVGSFATSGRDPAVKCKAVSDDVIDKWLSEYFISRSDSYWNPTTIEYLKTGNMPPSQYNGTSYPTLPPVASPSPVNTPDSGRSSGDGALEPHLLKTSVILGFVLVLLL